MGSQPHRKSSSSNEGAQLAGVYATFGTDDDDNVTGRGQCQPDQRILGLLVQDKRQRRAVDPRDDSTLVGRLTHGRDTGPP